MMKKTRDRIINIIFIIVFLVTMYGISYYIQKEYAYCIQDTDNGGKLVVFFLPLLFMFLVIPTGLAVFDLYYNVRYFCKRKAKRRAVKTILNVIASVVSVLILGNIAGFLYMMGTSYPFEYNIIKLMVVYLGLRVIYLIVGMFCYIKDVLETE